MATYYYNHRNPKCPIHVTAETLVVTPHTFKKNAPTWEEASVNYFYDNVPTDKPVNILDVGAQSGLYSLYAKYLPQSQFYSFEPFPKAYQLLNDNITLNGITNVKTYNIGLSKCKGECILNTSNTHNGLHTLGSKPLRFTDVVPVKIRVDTIDNIFYENDIPVDFIKIDTEGWEYFILQGGEKTIQKYKPLIQIEWNNVNMKQCNVDVNEFMIYIEHKMGYTKKQKISEELYLVPKISL
jgi:FkbM family methyltransferase